MYHSYDIFKKRQFETDAPISTTRSQSFSEIIVIWQPLEQLFIKPA